MTEFDSHIFEFFGILCEIIGSLYLANRYLVLKAPPVQFIYALATVFLHTRASDGLAYFGEMNQERASHSLRGVTFLLAGFVLRIIPHLVYFLGELNSYLR